MINILWAEKQQPDPELEEYLYVLFEIEGYKWSKTFPKDATKQQVLDDLNSNYDEILRWAKESTYDWGIKPDNVRDDVMDVERPKVSFRKSQLYGLTHEQLDTYIDKNMTDFASGKEILRKALHVILYLAKHTKLDEE